MDQLPVDVQNGPRLRVERLHVRRQRVGRQGLPRHARRESDPRANAPLHGSPDARVGLRAGHADLFPVVDERKTGEGEQQLGRQPGPRQVSVQVRQGPDLVVVPEKRRPAVIGHILLKPEHRLRQARGAAGPDGLEDRLRNTEGEVGVQLIGIVGEDRIRAVEHLPDRDRARMRATDVVPELSQHVVRPGRVSGLSVSPFHQVPHGIETQPVGAHVVEPVRGDALHLLAHRARRPVQVGHPVREEPVVVLLPYRRATPVVVAPFVVRTGPVRPAEPLAVGRVRVEQGMLEVGVLAGDVVDDHVHEHPDSPAMRFFHQAPEIVVRPVAGIDVVVVGDVVAVVAGRGGDRHQPDAVDAEIRAGLRVAVVQVVEASDQSRQVSVAVAVAVLEGAHEDLVAGAAVRPVRRQLLRPGVRPETQDERADRRQPCRSHEKLLVIRVTPGSAGRT